MLTKLQAACALTTQQASFTQNGHSPLSYISQPHMPQLRNINIRGRIRARDGGRAYDCGPLQEI